MATIAAFVFLNIIEYPACNGHFRFHHHLIKLRRFRLQSDGYATGTRGACQFFRQITQGRYPQSRTGRGRKTETAVLRSEERRVGKEGRSGWSPETEKKT